MGTHNKKQFLSPIWGILKLLAQQILPTFRMNVATGKRGRFSKTSSIATVRHGTDKVLPPVHIQEHRTMACPFQELLDTKPTLQPSTLFTSKPPGSPLFQTSIDRTWILKNTALRMIPTTTMFAHSNNFRHRVHITYSREGYRLTNYCTRSEASYGCVSLWREASDKSSFNHDITASSFGRMTGILSACAMKLAKIVLLHLTMPRFKLCKSFNGFSFPGI